MNTLASVLFELLVPERLERLATRNINLPDFFKPLVPSETRPAYNSQEEHKHMKLPPLSCKLVEKLADSLREVLLFPFLQGQRWETTRHASRALLDGLKKYANYLKSTTARINLVHERLEPARQPGDGISTSTRRIEGSVRGELHSRAFYDPLCLENYVPDDRRSRYFYVHELTLPFPVELHSYNTGGVACPLRSCR